MNKVVQVGVIIGLYGVRPEPVPVFGIGRNQAVTRVVRGVGVIVLNVGGSRGVCVVDKICVIESGGNGRVKSVDKLLQDGVGSFVFHNMLHGSGRYHVAGLSQDPVAL